nr:potassium channel family protein [Parvibaculum indicum]
MYSPCHASCAAYAPYGNTRETKVIRGATLLYSALLTVSIFFITALIHLGCLRWCSSGMASIPLTPSARVLAVAAALFAAHMAEISFYAGAYALAEHVFFIGGFIGKQFMAPLDYFYFSATTYTSLGIGDIFPTGHIRFLTGVEALNGLLLIAWSASFLFTLMNRIWDWQPCARP